jgi:hypothetical protein
MAKVIVERPRHGSGLPSKGKGYDRRDARLAWEDQPKREGMKVRVRSGAHKTLNEHLAPLRRYLAGNVGHPWDTIFADLCRYLNRNSAVQDHVRDHVNDYVATQVMIHGGEVCHADGHSIGRPLRTLFYVCPRTGILKKNRNPRCWYFRFPVKLAIHFLGDGSALVRHDGAWHMITIRKFPEHVWIRGIGVAPATNVPHWDTLLKTRLYRDQADRIYGRSIHAVSARRASKREVRRIVNSYPYASLVR